MSTLALVLVVAAALAATSALLALALAVAVCRAAAAGERLRELVDEDTAADDALLDRFAAHPVSDDDVIRALERWRDEHRGER